AGVRAIDGRASLDLGDAALLGGRVSGRIALNPQEREPGGELQLSLTDVDLGALVGLSGMSGPLPHGRGSAEIELFADGRPRELDRADLTGTFALRFDQGSIAGFDRPTFEELARGNAPFSLKEAAGGSFEFTAATVEGRIDHGLAELSRASFEGTEKTLSVAGVIPYRSGNVAMAGSIQERKGADSAAVGPAVNFLVGGTWPELVISPLKTLMETPAN
ncbi:MAG TPA: AsmA-like C-terminal region-containing protein, partial [Mycoplana sp.]|nr:AsmA-like C-terminal region-containing protein [Mycoplana sp.]